MRVRSLAWLLAPLLAFELLLCPPSFPGKPKVDVRVTVDDGIGKIPSTDSLSKSNSALQGPLPSAEIFYFNVTLVSDNAQAVAQNDGKWCIKGDFLLGNVEYHGTLSGNDLQIEVPEKNGKTRKSNFVVYDRKWRKLSDL